MDSTYDSEQARKDADFWLRCDYLNDCAGISDGIDWGKAKSVKRYRVRSYSKMYKTHDFLNVLRLSDEDELHKKITELDELAVEANQFLANSDIKGFLGIAIRAAEICEHSHAERIFRQRILQYDYQI